MPPPLRRASDPEQKTTRSVESPEELPPAPPPGSEKSIRWLRTAGLESGLGTGARPHLRTTTGFPPPAAGPSIARQTVPVSAYLLGSKSQRAKRSELPLPPAEGPRTDQTRR